MNSPLNNLSDSEVQIWPAFTDVLMNVTMILVLYLFAQAAINGQVSAALLEIQQRQLQLRQTVEATLPASARADVTIREDGNLQRYSFADWILFDSARAELRPLGMEVLGALGKSFRQHIGSFSQIQIEGHTDDRPLQKGARFPSNWELSSARATSVVRFLQDQSGLEPSLLSATGYSEYHPVDTEDNEEAKQRNRRIELVVVSSIKKVLEDANSAAVPTRQAVEAASP